MNNFDMGTSIIEYTIRETLYYIKAALISAVIFVFLKVAVATFFPGLLESPAPAPQSNTRESAPEKMEAPIPLPAIGPGPDGQNEQEPLISLEMIDDMSDQIKNIKIGLSKRTKAETRGLLTKVDQRLKIIRYMITTATAGSTTGEAQESIGVARIIDDIDHNISEHTSLLWPVRGRVISDFGSKPNGSRNDGINLAAPEGTDIYAAGDGVVIYSGNELSGYGNLILIRHNDTLTTAYAHAKERLVTRGDTVHSGETIARVGSTGSVTQSQLHFEIRIGKVAVDPRAYLLSNKVGNR